MRIITLVIGLYLLSACTPHYRTYYAMNAKNGREQGEVCRIGAPANYYVNLGEIEFQLNLDPMNTRTKQPFLKLYLPKATAFHEREIQVQLIPDEGQARVAAFNYVADYAYEKSRYEELPRRFGTNTHWVYLFHGEKFDQLGDRGHFIIPAFNLKNAVIPETKVHYQRRSYLGVLALNC